jgi:hypothetical protein
MTTSDRRRRRATAVLVALATLLTAPLASAQTAALPGAQPGNQDQATARALFNEARALMKAGHYDAACPKLEAAAKAYPSSGVLLNLGDCLEHVGRTASAWTEFGEAVSAAERANRADDAAEAHRRQGALEPKLSRLSITPTKEVPGLVVSRDGIELDRGAWGSAIPVDPGTHTVSAAAPGFEPWSQSANVGGASANVNLVIPALTPTPGPAIPPAPPTPAAAPSTTDATTSPSAPFWTGQRIASASIVGVGAAGLVVSGVLVGLAKSQDDTAKNETGTAKNTDSQSAANQGNVATIVAIVGGAFAVGGAVLWLTAPSAPAAGQVQVGTSGTGVLLRGSF